MKYLRVITATVIAFVFLAALAIGLGVIFSVKNINITIESYTLSRDTAEAEISGYKDEFLGLYKGKLISTVSEDDIAGDLTEWNCNYTLDSFEKVMPCTINITLLERRETYVFDNGDGTYGVYDFDGQFIRTAKSEDEIMNTTGETPSPNVMLRIPDASYVEEAAALGRAFQNSFSASFEEGAPIRSTVEYIYIVEKTASIAGNDVIFQLRSGIQIEIYDYEEDLEDKMSAAYGKFVGLGAEQKLTGYIYALTDNTGAITSAYQPSGKATDSE